MVVLLKDVGKAKGNLVLEDFLCRWGGMRWHWFEDFSNGLEVNFNSFMNSVADKIFDSEYLSLLKDEAREGDIDGIVDIVHEIDLIRDLKDLFAEFGKDIVIVPDSRVEQYEDWWVVSLNVGLRFRAGVKVDG